MLVIILAAAFAFACWRSGAWRRWREFYPTVLYVIAGNLTYKFVFCDYRLWTYAGTLGHTYTALIVMFLVFPPAVILYLSHYPDLNGAPKERSFFRQAVYILFWAGLSILPEFISYFIDGMEYDNGWSTLWSFILLLIAFAMIRLHYKKPLIVWPISAVFGAAIALLFGLPSPA